MNKMENKIKLNMCILNITSQKEIKTKTIESIRSKQIKQTNKQTD